MSTSQVDQVAAAINSLTLSDNSRDAVAAYLAGRAGGAGGGGSRGDDTSDCTSESDETAASIGGLLALWQALCLEFGLVQDPDNPELHPDLPSLPTTKTQARKLLNTRAHVNICDYFTERATLTSTPWGCLAHLVHPTAAALAQELRMWAKREGRRRYRIRRRLRLRGMNDEEIAEAVRGASKMFPRELAKCEGLNPLLRVVF
ncbi:hypothetical protein CC85DRAFT_310378 [Cutaneotrichosporon oleaginosum]|uniref:Uncharacterized protein n=1 Tax=Cutaneotrichosporon oleaginosum TaxID=879819 RepID=A0A0J0XYD9_9TREE|nr:uncharacterized protein CC85DRAFT_310378 [Cutaneotrichosporon oleaginosum]KLT46065.1 hypothetical protein CC85DRAFT_310378 [Cutaneotrichosporon oleaginosum]TXT06758.1 hypothetical protein COLE_06089 [Cutaneotrichosporon oleaginosum]